MSLNKRREKYDAIYKKQEVLYDEWLLEAINDAKDIKDFDTLKEKHIELLKECYESRKTTARWVQWFNIEFDMKAYFLKCLNKQREDDENVRKQLEEWNRISYCEHLSKREITTIIKDIRNNIRRMITDRINESEQE